MMVGARVVFAEPGVDQGVVRRLIVDPQEEELSRLQVGLELKSGEFERDGFGGWTFRFGCDCSGERVHLVFTIVCRVFIDRRCCF
jgi:hypothetical protein